MKTLTKIVSVALLLASTGFTGCIHSYSVTMGDQPAEEAHYVVVQTRQNGRVIVYDCLSYPDQEWEPTCVRSRMRRWARGRGDEPDQLVDECFTGLSTV